MANRIYTYAVLLTFMEYAQFLTRGNLSVFCMRCVRHKARKSTPEFSYETFASLMRSAPYCGLSDDAYILCQFATAESISHASTGSGRFLIENGSTDYFSALCARGSELISVSAGTEVKVMIPELEGYWMRYCRAERNTDAWHKTGALRLMMQLNDNVISARRLQNPAAPSAPAADNAAWQTEDFGTGISYPAAEAISKRARYLNTRCYGWLLALITVHDCLKLKNPDAAGHVNAAGRDPELMQWIGHCVEEAKHKSPAASAQALLDDSRLPGALKRWCAENWGLDRSTMAGPEYYATVLHYSALAANETQFDLNCLRSDLTSLADKYGETFSARALFLIADCLPFRQLSLLREKFTEKIPAAQPEALKSHVTLLQGADL